MRARTNAGFSLAGPRAKMFEGRRHGPHAAGAGRLRRADRALVVVHPGTTRRPSCFLILFVALITPPFMACFAAPALSASTAFMATLAATSAAVAAKVKMTICSTLAAWLLVVLFSSLHSCCRAGCRSSSNVRAPASKSRGHSAGLPSCCWCSRRSSPRRGKSRAEPVHRTARPRLVDQIARALALVAVVALGPLADVDHQGPNVQSVIWKRVAVILASLVCLN